MGFFCSFQIGTSGLFAATFAASIKNSGVESGNGMPRDLVLYIDHIGFSPSLRRNRFHSVGVNKNISYTFVPLVCQLKRQSSTTTFQKRAEIEIKDEFDLIYRHIYLFYFSSIRLKFQKRKSSSTKKCIH